MKRRMNLLVFLFSIWMPWVSQADIQEYYVFLNTDAVYTGQCVQDVVSGIDQRVAIRFDDSSFTLTGVEIQRCSAGGFSPPQILDPLDWAIGVAEGVDGSALIEGAIPRNLLGNPADLSLIMASGADSGGFSDLISANNDNENPSWFSSALVTPITSPIPTLSGSPIPTLSGFWVIGLIALLLTAVWYLRSNGYISHNVLMVLAFSPFFVSIAAFAATIIVDGRDDWPAGSLLGRDTQGDQVGADSRDILAAHSTSDAENVFVRLDVAAFKNPPVTISGVVLDNPVVGADVSIRSSGGEVLAETETDDQGRYVANVFQRDIGQGFEVRVTGGLVGGDLVGGELRASYGPSEDLDSANVTFVTTLIGQLADTLAGPSLLVRRDAAISQLQEIGLLLDLTDWSALVPDSVANEDLYGAVNEVGWESWPAAMVGDLADGDLSAQSMRGFPHAHGGIVSVLIGNAGGFSAFQGKENTLGVTVTQYDDTERALQFELINAPDGMSWLGVGAVQYNPGWDFGAGVISFQLRVTNTDTNRGRVIETEVYVMETEIVASGEIGPEGGSISDEWEEVILTVPEGAVEDTTLFQVIRAIDEQGMYQYATTATNDVSKLLQLSLPDTLLRRAPESPASQLRHDANRGVGIPTKDTSEGPWRFIKGHNATFLEVHRWLQNPTNRVRRDLPASQIPSHLNLTTHTLSAYNLLWLCGPNDGHEDECGLYDEDKEPVVFVHGYLAEGDDPDRGWDFWAIPGGQGGGQGTWGSFPELLRDNGYAVFEFTWRSYTRFRDVAADLADAIKRINQISRKKVHIVAHSFGGLVARTYLQGYAAGRPYDNDVQSLFTLGTPHSGILDADRVFHGVFFPKGQDSTSFEGCMQISCNQAGEPTPKAYEVPSKIPPSCWDNDLVHQCIADLETAGKLDISAEFGIDKIPGELVAMLADTSGIHSISVPVKAMIGLTVDRTPFIGYSEYDQPGLVDRYETGDALIRYEGQRFHPSLSCSVNSGECNASPTSASPIDVVQGEPVVEEILGFPHGAIPGGKVPIEYAFGEPGFLGIRPRIDFEGYRHSNTNAGQGPLFLGTSRGSVGEPYVDDGECDGYELQGDCEGDTKKPHAAITAALAWLNEHRQTAQQAPPVLNINFQVVDADTLAPVADAQLTVGVNSSSQGVGVTDGEGLVTVEVPFYPLTEYQAIVSAEGYHADEYDMDFVSGLTVALSPTDFPRILLEPDNPARGDLGGQITDAVTNAALADVSYELIRNERVVATGLTDATGRYRVDGLVRGLYESRLTKEGYLDAASFVNVQPNQVNLGDASMRRTLAEGQMSIRLTWGLDPRDLDSHLVKYDGNGNPLYHIYYAHKTDSITGDNLDLDDVTSYGPETTTIQSVDSSARYVFAVHHFSGLGSITSTSNADVTVDYGAHSPISLSAPTSGNGIWWKVFEINNGQIEPCQTGCMFDAQPWSQYVEGHLSSGSVTTLRWLSVMESHLPAK